MVRTSPLETIIWSSNLEKVLKDPRDAGGRRGECSEYVCETMITGKKLTTPSHQKNSWTTLIIWESHSMPLMWYKFEILKRYLNTHLSGHHTLCELPPLGPAYSAPYPDPAPTPRMAARFTSRLCTLNSDAALGKGCRPTSFISSRNSPPFAF